MFNRMFTSFLELSGKGAGSLEYALNVVHGELKDADTVIFNYIGENTTHKKGIYRAVANYYSILNSIKNIGKREISIKSSQFDHNRVLLEHLTRDVCIKGSVIWIDAEEYDQARKQLRLALDLSSYLNTRSLQESTKKPYTVGVCIQLKNHNCERHAKECFANNIRVRLCKGAYDLSYKPTEGVLLDRAERIIKLYNEYRNGLLEMATIGNMDLIMLALENELPIQILYGYHKRLMDYPYTTKVYLPFGTCWWPYIVRRIKERVNG